MKKNISFILHNLTYVLLFTSSIGCKKYLEIPLPIDQLSTETVFSNKATILSAVNGMYSSFGNGTIKSGYYQMTYWYSDEGEINPLPGGEIGDIISANIVAANSNGVPRLLWFYSSIFRANEIIERLPSVSTNIMSEVEKKQIIAAAKYVRAAEHFVLVNTWGDVPLVLTTNAKDNINQIRTPQGLVYDAIIKDLTEATADLSTTVNNTNSLTIHNKYQAQALLAKVYLYRGNWSDAEKAASDVINSGQYQLVAGMNNIFKKGSREAIFSMGQTSTGLLFDNRAFIGIRTIPATAGNTTTSYCAIPAGFLNNFETGDQRRINGNWIISLFGKNFANKYLHSSTATALQTAANPQDFIFQRLAELYLIRSEARAQQNNLIGTNSALADLNLIRNRAGLLNSTASTQSSILTAIEKERACELFYEGHRWYDLKRTNRLQQVLSSVPYKAANYKPHYNVLPIQLSELTSSPLLSQNPGY